MSMGQGQFGNSGTAPVQETGGTGNSQGQQTDTVPQDSLASPFLDAIPEADREVVSRYVKHWDQNVSRKFQDLHSQYAPYKELGDPSELQQAVQLLQVINTNPRQVYDILAEEFGQSQDQGQQSQQSQQQQTNADIFAAMPPELQEKFSQLDKHDKVLETLSDFFLKTQERDQQAEEDRELDNLLKGLRQKHGDFDTEDEEDFVLMKMQQGLDPDAAVQAMRKFTQGKINAANQETNSLPPILSGGGNIAQPPVDVNKLNNGEVKTLVAQMLQQSAQG